MTFKHEAMLVLIIAKYRLRQELSQYGFVYNRIILAIFFFYFAVLEIHVASKNFGANYIHKQVIKKKKNSANVEASPQGNLIIAKQRFALNSADAI